MRVKRVEKGGTLWARDYTQKYNRTYTQPLTDYIKAYLYHHVWEKLTTDLYGGLWKVLPHKREYQEFSDGKTYDITVPYQNRQDIRCDDLHHRNVIEISMEYGPKIYDHTGHPSPQDCAEADYYEDPANREPEGPGRRRGEPTER